MGPYCNVTRLYVEAPWLMEGQWFEDGEGFLYIVPALDAVAEVEGPDNALLDRLNWLARRYPDAIPTAETERLSLREVPYVLRRWTPLDGFYHA